MFRSALAQATVRDVTLLGIVSDNLLFRKSQVIESLSVLLLGNVLHEYLVLACYANRCADIDLRVKALVSLHVGQTLLLETVERYA